MKTEQEIRLEINNITESLVINVHRKGIVFNTGEILARLKALEWVLGEQE
jgi:hypothetical protein